MSTAVLRRGEGSPPSYGATHSTHFFNSAVTTSSSSSSSSGLDQREPLLLPAKEQKAAERHVSISVPAAAPSYSDAGSEGPFISFHEVSYEVNTGCCGRGGRKLILDALRSV